MQYFEFRFVTDFPGENEFVFEQREKCIAVLNLAFD